MKFISENVKLISVVILALFLGFLLGSGALDTSALTLIWSKPDTITFTKNPNSAYGSIGTLYTSQSIAAFDVRSTFTNDKPARLRKLVIDIPFRPRSSEKGNGLKNLSIYYVYCRQFGSNGYGYGFPCQTFSKTPDIINKTLANTKLTFYLDNGWPVYRDAYEAVIYLNGGVAYTGLTPVNAKTIELRGELVEGEISAVDPITQNELKISARNAKGNWLRVLGGYGYVAR